MDVKGYGDLRIFPTVYINYLEHSHGDAQLGPQDEEGPDGNGRFELAVSKLILHIQACRRKRKQSKREMKY